MIDNMKMGRMWGVGGDGRRRVRKDVKDECVMCEAGLVLDRRIVQIHGDV